MASWRPKTDLELEIVSLQPDHNFIYGDLTDTQRQLQNGYHSRPSAHLDYLKKRTKAKNLETENKLHSNGLHAIRAVQKMTGAINFVDMPSNSQDLADLDNRDRETVAMIRHCGMGPSDDKPLNEKTTIPTLPTRKDVHVVRNGRKKMPVIFDDDYFKMTSTRMRDRELSEKLNFLADEISGMKIEHDNLKFENITPLNEEEIKVPTKAEIEVENYQKFVAAYPKLEKQQVKTSSKGKPAAQSKKKSYTPLNEKHASVPTQKKNQKSTKESISSSLCSNNSSTSSSVYNSFENNDSNNSSKYFSAESQFSHNIKQKTSPANSYASVVQKNERPSKIAAGQRHYYTPREVYELKRHL